MRLKKKQLKPFDIDHIKIDDIKFQVKIFYETRNNTRASIGKNGVYIRIPVFLRDTERSKQVEKLKSWAQDKIKKNIHKYRLDCCFDIES